MSNKRRKVEQGSKPNTSKTTVDSISTPFDDSANFEYHIMDVVDSYLPRHQRLRNTFCHWFVKWGASKDYHAALDNSIREGDMKSAKYMVSQGAKLSLNHSIYVWEASHYGHLDVMKYLVSIGADITARWNRCAIGGASCNGHLDVVKYLVSLGADITAFDDTVCDTAYAHGYLGVVDYLVSQGAKIPTN